jgi:hypothetical protein
MDTASLELLESPCVCAPPIYRAVAPTVHIYRAGGEGSGTVRAARLAANQPSAARTWQRQRQSPDWATGRLTPGQIPVRRVAPVLTWRTSVPAGAQNYAMAQPRA